MSSRLNCLKADLNHSMSVKTGCMKDHTLMIKRVYKEEQEMARLYCVILFVTLVSDRIGKQPSTHVVREELQTTAQQGSRVVHGPLTSDLNNFFEVHSASHLSNIRIT